MATRSTLSCGNELTIQKIESFKGRLLASFEKHADHYTINASKVERIDSTGVQALLSFIHSLQNTQTVSWQKPSKAFISGCHILGATQLLQLDGYSGEIQ